MTPDANTHCADCGAALTGPYCAACGQRVVEDKDFSVVRLLREWVAAAFSFDSRGLTTLRRLLFQPGRLSADYIAGRRGDTFSPFQIFVLVTLAFFLLPDDYDILKAPARWFFPNVEMLVAAKMAALELTRDELAIVYDARVGTVSKLGLGIIVGLLALASWVMGFGRMRQYGKHLVISVHAFIVALGLILLFIPIFLAVFLLVEPSRWVTQTVYLLLLCAWLAAQQRRVLGIGWPRSVLHTVVLIAVLGASAIGYRQAISWLSLWSL